MTDSIPNLIPNPFQDSIVPSFPVLKCWLSTGTKYVYIKSTTVYVPSSELGTDIDTLEYQQTEKIETEMKDVDRIRRHTGVPNTVQGVLLGYPIHTNY